jgi:DNA polymerase-3 subunit chi
MDISFYHLTRTTLEAALPQMLEKTLERGQRAVVRAGSAERVEALNGWLWTYKDRGFLPHGSAKDGHAALQPIWLTEKDERPNEAQVLFLTDGAELGGAELGGAELGGAELGGAELGGAESGAEVAAFERCAVLFDGNDESALSAARNQWSGLKEAGHDLTYWQQNDEGRWEKRD